MLRLRNVALLIVILTACSASTLTYSGGTSAPGGTVLPTPEPGPIERSLTTCLANASRLAALAARLQSPTTAETLTARGSAVAQVTGIIAAELQGFRELDLSSAPGIGPQSPEWFAEMDALVDSGSSAVDASARGSLAAFAAAESAFIVHLMRSNDLAAAVGLPACAVKVAR